MPVTDKPYSGFVVGNRVPARDSRAGFGDFVRAAAKNFGEQFERQIVTPRGDIEREQSLRRPSRIRRSSRSPP